MKKNILLFCLIISLTSLAACEKKQENNNETSAATEETTVATDPTTQATDPTVNDALTIEDYFPFRENTKYVYEGEGNEYASYTVVTDYLEDDSVQLRTDNGGSETIQVLENKNGELTQVFFRGEAYYRENVIGKTEGEEEILLKEPLVKGTEWTLSDNTKRYISDVDVAIDTPYGTFKALEVTTEREEDTVKDYYALEVGLVKSVFIAGENEITSTLSDIKEDVTFNQTIRFYYPNVDKDVIYFEEKQISFRTNDVTREKLEEAVKDLSKDEFDQVLSENTKINSLFLDKDNIVNVDFSKELVDEMNAGAGYEAKILQCITNTLGNYYGANEVYITVDGKPYESGHILMKQGETFKVSLDDVMEQ
jgi:hypothetical protein